MTSKFIQIFRGVVCFYSEGKSVSGPTVSCQLVRTDDAFTHFFRVWPLIADEGFNDRLLNPPIRKKVRSIGAGLVLLFGQMAPNS